jgi:hypothetical protein
MIRKNSKGRYGRIGEEAWRTRRRLKRLSHPPQGLSPPSHPRNLFLPCHSRKSCWEAHSRSQTGGRLPVPEFLTEQSPTLNALSVVIVTYPLSTRHRESKRNRRPWNGSPIVNQMCHRPLDDLKYVSCSAIFRSTTCHTAQ